MELEAHPTQPFLVQLKEWKYREVKGFVQGVPVAKKPQFSSVQSLSRVRIFVTPWTAHQASLSITNSWSLLKLMSIESGMLRSLVH